MFGFYLRNMLRELGLQVQIAVRSGSNAAGGMVSRLGDGRRANHIDTQFLFAKGLVCDGEVTPKPVAGAENVADAGTKNVTTPALRHLLCLLWTRLLTLAGTAAGADAAGVQLA